MARARDQLDAAARNRRRHLLGDRAELGVALADHEHDRHRQLAEPAPQRVHRAAAEPTQGGGEPGRRVTQPVGVCGGRDPRILPREQRLRAPLLGERLDADRLDPVGQLRVGLPPLLALGHVRDPRAGPDQHEPLDQPREGERGVESDPAAHRVAHKRARAVGERPHVGRARSERRRTPFGGVAVAREVGRQRAIASAERRDRPPPALPGLGEAVQEDERHRVSPARRAAPSSRSPSATLP